MAKDLLGRRVTYTSKDGFPKAALVIATHDSIPEGTNVQRPDGTVLTRPDEGNVSLEVHSPTGKVYLRDNVREGSGAGRFALRG